MGILKPRQSSRLAVHVGSYVLHFIDTRQNNTRISINQLFKHANVGYSRIDGVCGMTYVHFRRQLSVPINSSRRSRKLLFCRIPIELLHFFESNKRAADDLKMKSARNATECRRNLFRRQRRRF